MTIYDLKLYGAYFPRLAGNPKVTLTDRPEGVLEKAPSEYRFEVELLKQYGSKQDVLELQFLDGHKEYVTLYEPTMYLDDGEWKVTENNDAAEAFLTMYELLKEKETIDKAQSIFEHTFYGFQQNLCFGLPKVSVYLSKTARDKSSSKGGFYFTATVLKEYKAKKYVVKIVPDKGETCYICLFNSTMYTAEGRRAWGCCDASPIPNEIMKCYIEYLNG